MVIFQSYVNVYQRVVVTMEYDGDHEGSLKPMKPWQRFVFGNVKKFEPQEIIGVAARHPCCQAEEESLVAAVYDEDPDETLEGYKFEAYLGPRESWRPGMNGKVSTRPSYKWFFSTRLSCAP
jgi:hypothetical protein